MKFRWHTGIIWISLLFGLLFWVAVAAAEAALLPESGLLDRLILDLRASDILYRALGWGFIVLSAVVTNRMTLNSGGGAFPRAPSPAERSAQAAIRESEARFREFTELLPEAVFETDDALNLTYANRRAFDLFGYTQADLDGGMHALSTLIPEDRDRAEGAFRRRAKGEEVGTVQYSALRKDGSSFPILFHAATILRGGRVAGIRGVIVDITELRQTEAALRESEARLRSIIRVAPTGIGVVRDRILTEVNDVICQMVNRTPDELIGQSARILYPTQETYEYVGEEKYRQIKAGGSGTVVTVATTWQDRDGKTLTVLLSSTPIDPSDLQKGVTFTALDITEQKNALAEAEARNEALRKAEAIAHVGSWTFDFQTGQVTGSEEARRIYGLEGSVWSIPRVQAIPLPQYRPLLDRALRELMEMGAPYDLVFEIRKADTGEVRTVHSVAEYDRKTKRVTGMVQDITRQKEAEASYRHSEERFRSVIEQSNDAIYILFEDRFDLVNRKFCQMVGVTPGEVQAPSFSFWELVSEKSRPLIRERQEKRARGEEIPDLYEFQIRRIDGGIVQVEASVTEIDYRGGRAILGVLRDVTDQKSLQAQLNQAQKMESIGRLSGGVAHDLNNLLTPIIGYAELLQDELPHEDPRRESAEEIARAGFRSRDLVRQLLAFSRQQTLEFRPLDLDALVAGFERLLRRTIREDIRIRVIHGDSVPFIRGDKGQLEQVLMNLAINAQDAMISGGTLHIETGEAVFDEAFSRSRPGVTPGRYALLAITDTGTGMDPETREKIFEPFFTTKERGKGTGLGLATVYGIVKQHGGNIWVYSEPGEGTTFKCYFPMAEAPVGTEAATQEKGPEAGGTETIMVVEDEALVRNLAVAILRKQGYQVFSAEDGRECLSLLEELPDPIDLLLTDVVLPGMNGRELQMELNQRFPTSRVLFMSGYSDDVVTHRGVLDAGISFLQKPFSVHALTEKVREVLDRK